MRCSGRDVPQSPTTRVLMVIYFTCTILQYKNLRHISLRPIFIILNILRSRIDKSISSRVQDTHLDGFPKRLLNLNIHSHFPRLQWVLMLFRRFLQSDGCEVETHFYLHFPNYHRLWGFVLFCCLDLLFYEFLYYLSLFLTVDMSKLHYRYEPFASPSYCNFSPKFVVDLFRHFKLVQKYFYG